MTASTIFEYFPDLNNHQKGQFESLHSLYKEWNDKINVISRKDIDHLYERHVLHSLAIAKFIQFNPGTKILDVGTGGGFPGIPLAILFPESRFLLVDSIGKKIKVVDEVTTSLGLENVRSAHERAERINEKFDFVISRAVTRAKTLYQWTHHLIKRDDHPTPANGYLLLKGGDLGQEMKELGKHYTIQDLSGYFDSEFFKTKRLVHIPL